MTLSNYKAIIFDWDGTLVDSTDWVLSAHNHVRLIMRLEPWTKEDIFGCSSLSARERYPQIYKDKSEEALQLLYRYTSENHLKAATPYPLALELLDVLKNKNRPMGIVSNKKHEPLVEVIEHLRWQDYFETAVGAGKAKRDKPSADPLLMALDLMEGNLTPRDILYVGDTETDLICAQNAGCDATLIQSDKPRPDLIEKYTPKYACHDLADFIKRMEG